MDRLEITPEEVRAKLQAGEKVLLLDVREAEEVAKLPALSGALHIPMGDIPGRTHELDPEVEIVVYCAWGQRSASVAKFLRERDFESVRSLCGGLASWGGKTA